MSTDTVRSVVLRVLASVAPEADLASLGADENLRQALDIDSMDWLRVVKGIRDELGVEIPEHEYVHLRTLRDCIGWLATHTNGERQHSPG